MISVRRRVPATGGSVRGAVWTMGPRAVALRERVGKDDEGVLVRVEWSLFVLMEPGVGERAPLGGMADATTSTRRIRGDDGGEAVRLALDNN